MATSFAGAAKAKVRGGTQGTPINVRVRAYKDDSGTVQYSYDWDVGGGPTKTGKIDLAQGTPPSEIKFHLKDDTGLNLSFYPSPTDAFWVNYAPACPTGAGNANGEFNLASPPSSSSNNLLKVLDTNASACELKYALRFNGDTYTDKNGAHPPYAYDPDLKNGGGGTRFDTSISAAMIFGVSAVAIVAITAVVWLIRS